MVKKTMYDPWQSITTRNGYCCDEVISALQKSIRRANEEDACKFAYELYITSPELEEKMWRRLLTISVEDIGMGNPMAAVVVNSLFQMRKEFDYADGDRPIYFIHAIRYLVQSQKDRSSDLLKNICIKGFAFYSLFNFILNSTSLLVGLTSTLFFLPSSAIYSHLCSLYLYT